MKIGDMEITLREFLLSIAILFIMGSIGFLISTKLHDYFTEKNSDYFRALKVDDNSEIFNYAINTEVGNVLAYGEFTANGSVDDELIKGEYSAIRKVEEHYVKKTRTESYKCGERRCTRTVTYYEWDVANEVLKKTPTFTFLNHNVTSDILSWGMYKYHSTVNTSTTKRFVYETVSTSFEGSLFTNTKGKVLNESKLYYNKSLNDVIESKKSSADTSSIVFWMIWIIVTVILVGLFYYLENRWLH